MRSLRYAGGGVVDLENVATPSIGADQALVRVRASALCGSERGALLAGHRGNTGHEAAGVIEALTAPTRDFGSASSSGLAAVTGCGRCDRCTTGRETQCRRGAVIGGGWHAEYAVVGVGALRPSNGARPDRRDADVG